MYTIMKVARETLPPLIQGNHRLSIPTSGILVQLAKQLNCQGSNQYIQPMPALKLEAEAWRFWFLCDLYVSVSSGSEGRCDREGGRGSKGLSRSAHESRGPPRVAGFWDVQIQGQRHGERMIHLLVQDGKVCKSRRNSSNIQKLSKMQAVFNIFDSSDFVYQCICINYSTLTCLYYVYSNLSIRPVNRYVATSVRHESHTMGFTTCSLVPSGPLKARRRGFWSGLTWALRTSTSRWTIFLSPNFVRHRLVCRSRQRGRRRRRCRRRPRLLARCLEAARQMSRPSTFAIFRGLQDVMRNMGFCCRYFRGLFLNAWEILWRLQQLGN